MPGFGGELDAHHCASELLLQEAEHPPQGLVLCWQFTYKV